MNMKEICIIVAKKILLFCLILIALYSPVISADASDLSKLPRSVIIIEKNQKTSYKVKEVPTVTYNGTTLSTSSFPIVKLDQTWMAAGEQFFRDQLGFGYLYDETTNKITMKNPALNTTMIFTVDSKTAQFNNVTVTLDHSVVKAKDVETGDTAFLFPLSSICAKSGITMTVSGSKFVLTDDLYYHNVKLSGDKLDPTKYSNVLDGIYIKKTTTAGERILFFDTINPLSGKNVQYTEISGKSAVQITFPKTKNLLGNISKSFSSGAITKLTIQENGSYSTIVTIQYNLKYIYTKKFSGSTMTTTFSISNYDLRIALPENVAFSKITATDQYWNKRFLIVIPGNHVSFYKSNAPIKNNSVIKSVKVAKTAEGNTKITVTTTKLQGYQLNEGNESYFTVKIGSPQSIYKNIVMLDAGHGGKDAGAVRNGLKEKKLNYTILYTKAKKYFEAQDSTVKAYWTRHTDTFINLYKRPKYSASYHADLFVSLHMNCSNNRSANGTEVYYSSNNNKKNSAGLTSRIVARKMLSTLTADLGTRKRGVKQAGFVVIKNNTVPSVLVELGFVSGNKDSKKLKRSSFQTKAAKSIYRSISNVFKAYPTGR